MRNVSSDGLRHELARPRGETVDGKLRVDRERGGVNRSVDHEQVVEAVVTQGTRVDHAPALIRTHGAAAHHVRRDHPVLPGFVRGLREHPLHIGFIARVDWVRGDHLLGAPGQLQQVLVNLALNSIQAMADGGEISVEAKLSTPTSQPNKIESDVKNKNEIQISITDNGKGIAEPDIERIFKPFYTTRKEGTGLGLAIVKRIIDQNNWRIEVKSEINRGSTFSVYIPLNEEKEI